MASHAHFHVLYEVKNDRFTCARYEYAFFQSYYLCRQLFTGKECYNAKKACPQKRFQKHSRGTSPVVIQTSSAAVLLLLCFRVDPIVRRTCSELQQSLITRM